MEGINLFGIGGVAFIVVMCLLVGMAVKNLPINNKWIPVICGAFGGALAAYAMASGVDVHATNYFEAVAIGIVSGLGSVGCHQIVKQLTGDITNNSANNTASLMAELEELRAKKISLEALLEAQQDEHDMNGDMVDNFVKEE